MRDTLELIAMISLFGFVILLVSFFVAMGFVGLFQNIRLKIKGNQLGMEPCRSCGRRISRSARICPVCGEDFGSMNGVYGSIFGCLLVIFGLSPLVLIGILQIYRCS